MTGESGEPDYGAAGSRSSTALADLPRLLPSGDEAGSPPGDREFRPDVEGLRAIAVLFVVLYHAGLSRLSGGYVGVDVFFVISGYVITGVLLRERATTGATSLLGFYARRARRILPAATLVLVVTVIAAHALLSVASAQQTADDAKWAALFLANFHFAAVGTNYLSAQLPPSPLQNFWTLSVEEQFYVVYPTIFLVVAGMRLRVSLRTKLLVALGVATFVSLCWSIVQTTTNPNAAYFSPFTRAWELALGAMVALAAPLFARIPAALAATVTWGGLGAIVLAGLVFNSQTPYPGAYVMLPVLGAAMVIAGGTANPRFGVERLLGTSPFRQLGRISYSLYLWHWPILILAAESQGQSSLPFSSNLGWLLVALGASIVTYWLVENPVRHSRWLRRRRAASVGMGAVLIGATLLVSNIVSPAAPRVPVALETAPVPTTTSVAAVESLVHAAPALKSVPADLVPALQSGGTEGYPPGSACWPVDYGATSMKPCLFGDAYGEKSMVLIGDSHSAMWFQTVDDIATAAHWKLWYLGKSACPDELLPMENPGNFGTPGGEWSQCDQWHGYAITQINRLHPNLVIVTQENHSAPGTRYYTDAQWRSGMEKFLASITVPGVQFAVIGNIPQLPEDPQQCLNAHADDLGACSATVAKSLNRYGQAERAAVEAVGGRYVDVTPWLCSATCTAVIGRYQVYFNQAHIMGPYAEFLRGVMGKALQLPQSSDTPWSISPELTYPRSGAVLKGTVALSVDAKMKGVPEHSDAQVLLNGEGRTNEVVATLVQSLLGWIARWNTATVPNGDYTLTIRMTTGNGGSGTSSPVPVRVMN
jgi:peptidoglycan/LPS O-acetylase OafA/YrhL